MNPRQKDVALKVSAANLTKAFWILTVHGLQLSVNGYFESYNNKNEKRVKGLFHIILEIVHSLFQSQAQRVDISP